MCENKFSLRAKILLSFLLTWAAVAAAHVFYYSAVERDRLNAEGESFAWREGSIPAPRGRILDKKGVALAWTELYHDLMLETPPLREARRNSLAKALGKLPFPITAPEKTYVKGAVLKSALTPEQLSACAHILAEFPELGVQPRFKRRSIDYPEVKRLLGRTSQGPELGALAGLDGQERLLDKRLEGHPGRFKVMLDKNGHWIEGTLKMLEQPQRGEDVCLVLSLDEIRDGATDGRM